jgi:hypothetical protein
MINQPGKWVLTLQPSDGGAIHAEDSIPDHLQKIIEVLSLKEGEYTLEEMPWTWECSGVDGCRMPS